MAARMGLASIALLAFLCVATTSAASVGGCTDAVVDVNPDTYASYAGCTRLDGNVTVRLSCDNEPTTDNWRFPNLQTIGGSLVIMDMRDAVCHVTHLPGFNSLVSIGGKFTLFLANFLKNVTGFQSLASVNGELSFGSLPSLTHVSALRSLSSVRGVRVWYMSPKFTNLNWLSQLSTVNGGSIRLEQSLGLASLAGLRNALASVGDVVVAGTGLTNFRGAEALTSIAGNLLIDANPNLLSLDGLQHLATVTGSAQITHCLNLSSIAGFASLTKVQGTLLLLDLPLISSLAGLRSLTSVGASAIARLHIEQLPFLKSLDGLQSIVSVTGLTLGLIPQLVDLSPIANLKRVDGRVNFFMLPSVTKMNLNLEAITGDLYIDVIENLSELNLPQLSSIGGSLVVRDCPTITSLDGLKALTTIGGALRLDNVRALKSVEVFNRFVSFRSLLPDIPALGVANCHALTDLSGFRNVKTLEGNLELAHNPNLIRLDSLCSLQNVDGHVRVSFSPFLCCPAIRQIFAGVTITGGPAQTGDCDPDCKTPGSNVTCSKAPEHFVPQVVLF